ncbi:unnamed protein product [Orchesella dallaii]|uniref:Coiled-coil domain-containing protein 86 n=1 Tax=Orchesella dallaii TaxID=48710 RepID=A0ABP1S319_9HEXA
MGKANPVKKSTGPTLSSVKAPKGKSKSGRVWKSEKQRASTVRKHKRDTFQKKQELRELKKSVKEQSRAIVEQKKTEQQQKRDREAENKRRKEENAKKSEIVQVIRNTSKLKRMKKKQLRQVETRDTTVVEKSA